MKITYSIRNNIKKKKKRAINQMYIRMEKLRNQMICRQFNIEIDDLKKKT